MCFGPDCAAACSTRRGELVLRLPVGFVRDGIGRVVLDPDQQVRQLVGPFFDTFSQLGTGQGTVRAFRVQNIKFPKRLHGGADKGKLTWGPLTTSPFPITISTTPGTPVLTAVLNQCRGAGTPISTVFPGGPLAIEGDAIDTSGTSIVFTPITAVGGVLTQSFLSSTGGPSGRVCSYEVANAPPFPAVGAPAGLTPGTWSVQIRTTVSGFPSALSNAIVITVPNP